MRAFTLAAAWQSLDPGGHLLSLLGYHKPQGEGGGEEEGGVTEANLGQKYKNIALGLGVMFIFL